MDCIFCKFVKGEIPCHKIYENEKVISFLDINPTNKGHLLIIPKKHVTRFKDMDKETLVDIFNAMQIILNKVEPKISQSYHILINQGKEAGQSVEHLHIHIIPRHVKDGLMISLPSKKLTEADAMELLNKLK